MPATTKPVRYVSLREFARRLGCTKDAAVRLARTGAIGSLLVPGSQRRLYDCRDVERIRARFTTPPRPDAGPSPAPSQPREVHHVSADRID